MTTQTNGQAVVVYTVGISIKIGDYGARDHVSRHVEVQLNTAQARALKRAFVGLDEAGERLANGRRIASNADVVRYLLEQVATARFPDAGTSTPENPTNPTNPAGEMS